MNNYGVSYILFSKENTINNTWWWSHFYYVWEFLGQMRTWIFIIMYPKWHLMCPSVTQLVFFFVHLICKIDISNCFFYYYLLSVSVQSFTYQIIWIFWVKENYQSWWINKKNWLSISIAWKCVVDKEPYQHWWTN